MEWQDLLRDVESLADAADEARALSEAADRTRRERSASSWMDRVRAVMGREVGCELLDGGTLAGVLADAGPDWLLLADLLSQPRETLVPAHAVVSLRGVGGWSDAPPLGPTAQRLDLRWALGRIARDRSAVRVGLAQGRVLSGTLDRVGSDHVDLAVHDIDALRRVTEVVDHRVIPLAGVTFVQRA
jgi:hypothetical protein